VDPFGHLFVVWIGKHSIQSMGGKTKKRNSLKK
jgi:hypothetical protein